MAANGSAMIVKRKKVVDGGGHHGGAWKVAYADFVTAMMAFFLLMWLLNATSEEQKEGLAQYFDPKVPIAQISGGGTGMFGGDNFFSQAKMAQNGTGASDRMPTASRQAEGDSGQDAQSDRDFDGAGDELTALDNMFRGMSGESEAADELLSHVRTRVTDEGLVIELFDSDDKSLFERGSSRPTPQMQALLNMVGEAAKLVTNRIAVEGHTDSVPFAGGTGYDNWELSTDRAQSARRALLDAGVVTDRMARVVGKADRDPADAAHPEGPRNRRVAITLLRSDI